MPETGNLQIRQTTNTSAMLLELPASVEGNGPTMATLVEVGQILEAARGEPPLSLAEIGRRMTAKQVRHGAIRASVDFLAQLGFVTADRNGVLWTYVTDPRTWKSVGRGRRLA